LVGGHSRNNWSFLSFRGSKTDPAKDHHNAHHGEVSEHHHHGGVVGAKHQFSHRAREKIGMKIVEKAMSVGLPRLVAMKKRLGFAIFARKFVRGVAIAVPAVGGIFGTLVAMSDIRRTLKEKERGNRNVMTAFATASFLDIVDVACHGYTAMLLSSAHWHHHEIHLTEQLSLGAAILATVAAITGEIITPVAVKIAAQHQGEVGHKSKLMGGIITQLHGNKMLLSSAKKHDDHKEDHGHKDDHGSHGGHHDDPYDEHNPVYRPHDDYYTKEERDAIQDKEKTVDGPYNQ